MIDLSTSGGFLTASSASICGSSDSSWEDLVGDLGEAVFDLCSDAVFDRPGGEVGSLGGEDLSSEPTAVPAILFAMEKWELNFRVEI